MNDNMTTRGRGTLSRCITCAALFSAVLLGGKALGETGLDAISDVRVAPMIASGWTQNTFGGAAAFNLYLPNKYPSGCAVTAFAQLMRYWQYPVNAVAPGSYFCWVDGVGKSYMMQGGTYDWDLMPLVDEDCTDNAQREALGHLAYDLCVASHVAWSEWSGTYSVLVAEALQERFGYASVRTFYPPSDLVTANTSIMSLPDYKNAILASLDAGMPVVLSCTNKDGVNHQMVVDGYGFNGGTDVYCHLNCGWGGAENRWYNLVAEEVTELFRFIGVVDVAYNIHPTQTGDVISGRVLDSAGQPISNVKVSLSGAASGEATSNAQGIFFFRVSGKGKFVLSVADAHGKISRSVTIAKAGKNVQGELNETDGIYYSSSLGIVANQWGVDLVLSNSAKVPDGADSDGKPDSSEPAGQPDGSAPAEQPDGTELAFKATSAAVFDGTLLNGGLVAGTIIVKAGKANGNGESKLAASVISVGSGKKLSYKGTMAANGWATLTCPGQANMVLFLGTTEMKGDCGAYKVTGARNLFSSKDGTELAKANAALGSWIGTINVVWPSGTKGWNALSLAVAKKGKVKVAGTLADGTKVSTTAQAILEDAALSIPVVNTKKVSLACLLALPLSGDGVTVTGIDGAVAGKVKTLAGTATFKMDAAAFSALLGNDVTFADYLPTGISVKQSGTKWIVANGARAGTVAFVKGSEQVDAGKAGANPSALKLSYAAKTGTFKGSFKAYRLTNGKPKAVNVTVSGALVSGVGYGTATIKNVGSVSLEISP